MGICFCSRQSIRNQTDPSTSKQQETPANHRSELRRQWLSPRKGQDPWKVGSAVVCPQLHFREERHYRGILCTSWAQRQSWAIRQLKFTGERPREMARGLLGTWLGYSEIRSSKKCPALDRCDNDLRKTISKEAGFYASEICQHFLIL